MIKTSASDDEPAAEHWKSDRADWMSFRTLCASRLSDELALLEDPVARFTDTLIEIANETIQKSHISKTKIVLNDRKLITDKKQIADLLASTIFHNSSSQNYSKQLLITKLFKTIPSY